MGNVWQTIKSGARDTVRSFFSPILRLRKRGSPEGSQPPREMSIHDFEVPVRDSVMRWLELWGPVLVIGLVTLAILAGLWWLG